MSRVATYLIGTLFSFFWLPSCYGAEVLALGTSNTNCKGVERPLSYTVSLQGLLNSNGINVDVINGGVDGDKPFWMISRANSLINEQTRLVIFEPGPNDTNKASNVEYSEKILDQLRAKRIPVIYVSHASIQNESEAQETAYKFGAYYYGHWNKDVPTDRIHRQYDMPGKAGHMTGVGCQLWAKNIAPLVEQVLREKYGNEIVPIRGR